MGLQVRIFIGTLSPSVFALDAPVISIGSASYCDVNLDQPGIPSIACLLEKSSRNDIYIQTQHSDLVLLDSEFLDKSQKKLWQVSQELLVGSHCRLILENSDAPGSTSKSNPSTKTVRSPAPSPSQEKTSQTQSKRTKEETTDSHQTSTSSTRSSSFPSPTKANKAPEGSSPSLSAATPEAVEPPKSSPALMALVILGTLAICMGMLMFDTSSPPPKGSIPTNELMDLLNKTIDSMSSRDKEKKNVENIRQRLQNAYAQKNNPREAKRIYMSIKQDITYQHYSSPQLVELKEKTLQYVNFQLMQE